MRNRFVRDLLLCAALAGAATSAMAQEAAKSEKASLSPDARHPMPITKLLGVNATADHGENFGQIQDFIVDLTTGQVRFALVGKGFMAGLGEKVVLVPWEALNLQAQKEFVAKISPEKMQGLPLWHDGDMEQPNYVIQVYRHFEIEPAEAHGGEGRGGGQAGQGQGSSTDGAKQEKNSPAIGQGHAPEKNK
ncbi:MAG: PRC-barrel domain-containing protein [Verrucomicrobiota bacterium]